uniref:Glycosyltransferase n=1 Tax=Fervidobacterium pennivorans TaxID=93466 RepID=A0A7V4NH20_FERPE
MTYPVTVHVVIYSSLESCGGGRERWLSYFLRGIHDKVELLNVYFLERGGKNNHTIDSRLSHISNVSWYPIRARNYLEWIFRTTVFLVQNVSDNDLVLSVGSGPEGVVGMLVKRRAPGVKLTVWLRTILKNELLGRKNGIFAFFASIVEKRILKIADCIIANGWDTRDHYQLIVEKEIEVIPNAVDNLDELSKLPLPAFRKPLRVAFLGRFVKERGSDIFTQIASLLKQDSDFVFEVYGPSYGSEKQINLSNVIFYGSYLPEDVIRILSNIDIAIFTLPSKGIHGGGVSHGLLEAMAAKRLIIAWRNALVVSNELLDDESAILCEEGNVQEVSSALLEVKSNPSKFFGKCLRASQKASKFGVSSHVNAFLKVLKKLYE